MLKTFLATCLAMIFACVMPHRAAAATPIPQDQSNTVIIAYHRVGEDLYTETNLTTEQFQEHLKIIQNGGYTALSLPDAMHKVAAGAPIPEKSIIITFEGAYKSAYDNAMKPLLALDIPFTVFYTSGALDSKDPEFIDWKTLKKLHQNENVTIGTLPASYTHITHEEDTQSLKSLNKARQRHREMLGEEADYLSYPFGEYSTALQNMAKTQGFKAAFTLNSGTTHPSSDLYALPRFSVTERYGNADRFRLVTHALPLPVTDLVPEDPFLNDTDWFTGFTLPGALSDQSDTLSCFISGESNPDIQILGNRVEIRPQTPLSQDRIRVNCTMPGPEAEGETPQWRWLGLLYHHNSEEELHTRDE